MAIGQKLVVAPSVPDERGGWRLGDVEEKYGQFGCGVRCEEGVEHEGLALVAVWKDGWWVEDDEVRGLFLACPKPEPTPEGT